MIHKAGAGPAPIPHKKLGVDNLCDAILVAISEECQMAAQKMAVQIRDDVSPIRYVLAQQVQLTFLTEWGGERRRELLSTFAAHEYEV